MRVFNQSMPPTPNLRQKPTFTRNIQDQNVAMGK